MAIIRTKQERKFTTISNKVYADNHLSFQAMGLLSYLLSKPDNWSVSPSHLAKVTNNTAKRTGRDGVYSILKELKNAGYIQTQKQSTGEIDYLVLDEPNTDYTEQVKKQAVSQTQKPDTDKPDMDKPDLDKPTLINTDNKQILNTNNIPPISPEGNESPEVVVLHYLNEKRSALYTQLGIKARELRLVASNLKPIRTVLKMKYTVEQIKLVIDHLVVRWGNDPSMRDYLNAQAIFRSTKFETKFVWAQEWDDNGKPAIGKPAANAPSIDWNDTTWADGLNMEKR